LAGHEGGLRVGREIDRTRRYEYLTPLEEMRCAIICFSFETGVMTSTMGVQHARVARAYITRSLLLHSFAHWFFCPAVILSSLRAPKPEAA